MNHTRVVIARVCCHGVFMGLTAPVPCSTALFEHSVWIISSCRTAR